MNQLSRRIIALARSRRGWTVAGLSLLVLFFLLPSLHHVLGHHHGTAGSHCTLCEVLSLTMVAVTAVLATVLVGCLWRVVRPLGDLPPPSHLMQPRSARSPPLPD